MNADESSTKVRGGILLAKALAEKQIEMVYTLSGGFINTVLEGLMEYDIPVMNLPHEQVAGNMADAWARLNRKAVVCLVGPEGFANVVPAMADDFATVVELTDLTPATTYFYEVTVDGAVARSGLSFTTAPEGPAAFDVAFGSCARYPSVMPGLTSTSP